MAALVIYYPIYLALRLLEYTMTFNRNSDVTVARSYDFIPTVEFSANESTVDIAFLMRERSSSCKKIVIAEI
jgi:hypothetical protein